MTIDRRSFKQFRDITAHTSADAQMRVARGHIDGTLLEELLLPWPRAPEAYTNRSGAWQMTQ